MSLLHLTVNILYVILSVSTLLKFQYYCCLAPTGVEPAPLYSSIQILQESIGCHGHTRTSHLHLKRLKHPDPLKQRKCVLLS